MSNRNPKNLNTEKSPIQNRREQLGYTQEELSLMIDRPRIMIQRAEQGTLNYIPDDLLTALYSNDKDGAVAAQQCQNEYVEWRSRVRHRNAVYLRDLIENPSKWDGSWMSFRTAISPSKAGFCKMFCLHPQVLDNFEKEHLVLKREHLSEGLQRCFLDCGLTIKEILQIETRLYSYAKRWK